VAYAEIGEVLKMSELKLKTSKNGLILERKFWDYDEEKETGQWIYTDVTDQTIEFLFHEITLDENIKLSDVFDLIEKNPLMKTIYRQDYVNELCDEVKKGFLEKVEPKTQQIEYLELYQQWSFNSESKEYQSVGSYNFHGVGFIQPVDLYDGVTENYAGWLQCKKGDRIKWSIAMSPVREMLNLPVRFSPEVIVCEDDFDSKKYLQEISSGISSTITFGLFIKSILWELSWHGSPADTELAYDKLMRRSDEVKADTVELISHDDVFENLGFPSRFDVFSMYMNNVTKDNWKEIDGVIHDIDDQDMAIVAFLDKKYFLKPEYENLTGHDLRKLIRKTRNN